MQRAMSMPVFDFRQFPKIVGKDGTDRFRKSRGLCRLSILPMVKRGTRMYNVLKSFQRNDLPSEGDEEIPMKNTEINLNTKKKMAASLKKLSCEKGFSKVTVSGIIEDCNINRNTFYYHFQDIYDLLEWTLRQEFLPIKEDVGIEKALLHLMDYVEDNARFCKSIYRSLGKEIWRERLKAHIIGEMQHWIHDLVRERNFAVSESFQAFLGNFYTDAMIGVLFTWFDNPSEENKRQIVAYSTFTLQTTLPVILGQAENQAADTL